MQDKMDRDLALPQLLFLGYLRTIIGFLSLESRQQGF